MVRENKFKMGDLVFIAGSTETEKGIFPSTPCIGRIETCGIFDSFIRIVTTDKIIKISNSRCNLIEENVESLVIDTRKPRIGDLVFSYWEKFRQPEQRVGVLLEIVDNPGKIKMSKILVETEDASVPFDSLITLEEK